MPSSESARLGQAIARFGEARHAVSLLFRGGWGWGWVGGEIKTKTKLSPARASLLAELGNEDNQIYLSSKTKSLHWKACWGIYIEINMLC